MKYKNESNIKDILDILSFLLIKYFHKYQDLIYGFIIHFVIYALFINARLRIFLRIFYLS